MTPHQVNLVQTTWQQVVPIASQAAALFYRRLFEIDPELRRLFRTDLAEQGAKLVSAIGVAVAKLDGLDEIVPVVQMLGRRHAGYGVEPRHYDTVGTALLWTLKHGLGTAFTPEVKEAWAAASGTLASTMKAAAYETA
jgi:hemoglobin-like flavoprotein